MGYGNKQKYPEIKYVSTFKEQIASLYEFYNEESIVNKETHKEKKEVKKEYDERYRQELKKNIIEYVERGLHQYLNKQPIKTLEQFNDDVNKYKLCVEIKNNDYIPYNTVNKTSDRSSNEEDLWSDVQGDGNCFFRAISLVMSGKEGNHMYYRKMAIDAFLNDTKAYEFIVCPTNQTPDQAAKAYADKYSKDGAWVSDDNSMEILIEVLSNALEIKFIIRTDSGVKTIGKEKEYNKYITLKLQNNHYKVAQSMTNALLTDLEIFNIHAQLEVEESSDNKDAAWSNDYNDQSYTAKA